MAMEGGGGNLSEVYHNSKRLPLQTRDGLERLERLKSPSSVSIGAGSVAVDSPELSFAINIDNGNSAHVLRFFDDKAQAMQSAHNSARMMEEACSTGVAVLSKFSKQREHMKSAQWKALDILNTVGLLNSVLKLIERRNRVDRWIKYAGMILTIVAVILFWRWTH